MSPNVTIVMIDAAIQTPRKIAGMAFNRMSNTAAARATG